MNYTAIIRALKSTDDSTTLANPRIATIDGKEAVINMGQEVPILKSEKDDDGQTSTNISFRDVGTVLKITPRINNNQIRMNIKPEVSEVDHWEGSYPVINTKKVETNIIVKNGETIVIGGLISEKEINQLSKVPLFGDVPIFGELFKSRRTTKKNENWLSLLPLELSRIMDRLMRKRRIFRPRFIVKTKKINNSPVESPD